MADGTDLIDIYADEEFVQVGEARTDAQTDEQLLRHLQESEFAAEQVDLYDDLLAVASLVSSHSDGKANDLEPPSPVLASSTKSNRTPAILYRYNNLRKKTSLYIGNFSWWTTDRQLLSLIRSIGVSDRVEVKFAENRANGQSKGYAEVVVCSETAVNQIMEQVPLKKLDGEKLEVRPANRQNLSYFEAIARKKIPPRPNAKGSVDFADGSATPTDTAVYSPLPETPKGIMPYFVRPPFIENPSRIPVMSLPQPPMSLPPPPAPTMQAAYRAPPMPPVHYPHLMPPPSRLPPPLGMPPPSGVPPALHLNPAFFPPPNSMMAPTHDQFKMHANPYMRGRDMKLPVCDAEFEELMNRNRAISRSALSNAVCGATSGDYGTAIKTLETAIAVIKESRVSNDERCRVLLTSLRDCLHGIQDKANSSSRKRHRSRDRSPSRSREGSSRRHRDPHEDQSDDYYYDRHRNKDRHR